MDRRLIKARKRMPLSEVFSFYEVFLSHSMLNRSMKAAENKLLGITFNY